MKTLAEKIAIMQACLDGKKIEWCYRGDDIWAPVFAPKFNWAKYDYRIKQEPKIIYVNEYSNETTPMAHTTKERAIVAARSDCTRKAVPYMEMIE